MWDDNWNYFTYISCQRIWVYILYQEQRMYYSKANLASELRSYNL